MKRNTLRRFSGAATVLVASLSVWPAPVSAGITLQDILENLENGTGGNKGAPAKSTISQEMRSSWNAIVPEVQRQVDRVENCLTHDRDYCERRAYERWTDIVEKASEFRGSRRAMARQINHLVNDRYGYQDDPQGNWRTPVEFVKYAGDCEDFALLKLATLRVLDVPAKALDLVVIRDTTRKRYHAVTTVKTRQGEIVLDSLSNLIFQRRKYDHYKRVIEISPSF